MHNEREKNSFSLMKKVEINGNVKKLLINIVLIIESISIGYYPSDLFKCNFERFIQNYKDRNYKSDQSRLIGSRLQN